MADGSSQGGVVTPKQDKHLALQGDDTYISTTTRTTLDSESHAPTPYLPAHEESSAAPMASDRDPLRTAQDSVSTQDIMPWTTTGREAHRWGTRVEVKQQHQLSRHHPFRGLL